MNKKFCIQTLTHNDANRDLFLERTISSFIENTTISESIKNKDGKLDWFIRINGLSTQMELVISTLQNKYAQKVDFHVHFGENIGVGAGINFLNNLCKEYEYVLFLEGDWQCLPEERTGIATNWLQTSIDLLDKDKEVHQIFLRRYTSDLEDRQHGMADWIDEANLVGDFSKVWVKEGIFYLRLKRHCYTNNPTIRRLKTYFDLEVFPLNEYYDSKGNPTELKGFEDWGKAEMEAYGKPSSLGAYWLKFGNFVHIDHLDGLWNYIGCKNCKYGFYSANEWFCLGCSVEEDFTKLPTHQNRVVQEVLPIVDNLMLAKDLKFEQSLLEIQQLVPSPTIDLKHLLLRITKVDEI